MGGLLTHSNSVLEITGRQWRRTRLGSVSGLRTQPRQPSPSRNIKVANQTLRLETGLGTRNGDRNAVRPAQGCRRPSLELGLIPRVDVLDPRGSLIKHGELCKQVRLRATHRMIKKYRRWQGR